MAPGVPLILNELVPAVALALICLAIGGWSGLVVGFFWSTVLVYHATFCINSLAHVHGRRRYVTGDDSRNNWLLALFTMGEGWHNNHHAFQTSARHGLDWWEIDPTYWVIQFLSKLGMAGNIKLAKVQRNRAAAVDPTLNGGTAQSFVDDPNQFVPADDPHQFVSVES